MKIRKIAPEDRKPLQDILKKTGMFTREEVGVALELIDIFLNNKKQKDYIIFAAAENDTVLGYVCFGPTPATEGTYDLYWIAVSPALQNKGIGKKLLAFSEAKIRSRGGRMVVIETSSKEKYQPTRDFYLRNGYRVEAVIKDFYRVDDHRVIFVKHFI